MNQKDKTPQNSNEPLHPWYVSINFRSFQIYSQIDYPTQAYENRTLKWVTNYTD